MSSSKTCLILNSCLILLSVQYLERTDFPIHWFNFLRPNGHFCVYPDRQVWSWAACFLSTLSRLKWYRQQSRLPCVGFCGSVVMFYSKGPGRTHWRDICQVSLFGPQNKKMYLEISGTCQSGPEESKLFLCNNLLTQSSYSNRIEFIYSSDTFISQTTITNNIIRVFLMPVLCWRV